VRSSGPEVAPHTLQTVALRLARKLPFREDGHAGPSPPVGREERCGECRRTLKNHATVSFPGRADRSLMKCRPDTAWAGVGNMSGLSLYSPLLSRGKRPELKEDK
jgi:hypothetical protein